MTLPITLLATDNNVTPCQFLHSFKSRLGIFTVKPFFYWSGSFSTCHILLNSVVNSFTATSLSALHSSTGTVDSRCSATLCLLQCLPHFCFLYLCCIHLLISSVSTSFSSIDLIRASLTSTSSKCSAHLLSLAFLSFNLLSHPSCSDFCNLTPSLVCDVFSPGGVFPYENDGGCRRKFLKTPLKGTRIPFCGCGFEFIITPTRYQF